MNNWQAVVEEQLQLLKESGLYTAMERLDCMVLGEGEHPLLDDPKIHVQRYASILEFEFPTLARLKQRADTEEPHFTLYFHTKGVRTGSDQAADLRQMMGYFLLERWQEAVAKLTAGYDCVGCNSATMPWPSPEDYFHFSGNFFWVTSEHIRRLPAIHTLDPLHRELAEAWLGMAGQPHAYTAHRSGVDHNHNRYPPHRYRNQ